MASPPVPQDLSTPLARLLDVEAVGLDSFFGPRRPDGTGRVFGGQLIAQGLQAAQRSVPADKVAHALHARFLWPGKQALPILYRVERDHDGRSFAGRRVVAWQEDRPIFQMTAGFQRPEAGLHHQLPMPDVPGPDTLRSDAELRREIADGLPERARAAFLRPSLIELRPVTPPGWADRTPRAPVQHHWFRAAPVGDDPALHRAILAYASDTVLLSTALLPHGVHWATDRVQAASLDHALWLHAPCRADDWLLYTADSPWAGHGRGFSRGRIYTQAGQLVASVAQEALIRRISQVRAADSR